MAYISVTHSLALRATHASTFSPLGLSMQTIPSTPVPATCIQLLRSRMKTAECANVLIVPRAPIAGHVTPAHCPVSLLAQLRTAMHTTLLEKGYDQLACIEAEAAASSVGDTGSSVSSITEVPLFIMDAGDTQINRQDTSRKVNKLLGNALDSLGLHKAGRKWQGEVDAA